MQTTISPQVTYQEGRSGITIGWKVIQVLKLNQLW